MGAPGAVQILHGRRLAGDRRPTRARGGAGRARRGVRGPLPRTRTSPPSVATSTTSSPRATRAGCWPTRSRALGTKREPRTRPPPRQHPAVGCRAREEARRCCSTASASWSPASSTTRRSRSPSARLAQEQGAEVVLTSFGRVHAPHRSAPPAACRTPTPQIVELDVTKPRTTSTALAGNVGGRLDGVLHALGVRARVVPRRRRSSTRPGRTSRSRCRSRRTR